MSNYFKKVLSILMLASLVISSLTIPGLIPTANAASIANAKSYAAATVSWEYYNHTAYGGSTDAVINRSGPAGRDMQPGFMCAEFVARVLAFGGLITGIDAYNSPPDNLLVYRSGQQYNLKTVKDLYDLLMNSGVGTDVGANLSQAREGDVVFFGDVESYPSAEIPQHVAFITRVDSNGHPRITAHNGAEQDFDIYYGYSPSVEHIVQINWNSSIAVTVGSNSPVQLTSPAPYKGGMVARDAYNPDLLISWNQLVGVQGYTIKIFDYNGVNLVSATNLGYASTSYRFRLWGARDYGAYSYFIGILGDNTYRHKTDDFHYVPLYCLGATSLTGECAQKTITGQGGSSYDPPNPPSTPSSPSNGIRVCSDTSGNGQCGNFTYSSSSACIYLDSVAGHNKSIYFYGSYVGNYDAIFYHNTDCNGYLTRYGSDNSNIGSGLYDQFYSMRIEQKSIDALMVCSATNMAGNCVKFYYTSDSTCIGLGLVAADTYSLDFLGTYDGKFDAIFYSDSGCNTYMARYGQDVSDMGSSMYHSLNSVRLERHKTPGQLTLVSPSIFSLSTTSAQVGQYVTTRFGVLNIGESAVTIQNIATAVRYGTSWEAPQYDYPAVSNITLNPGESYYYLDRKSFTSPGGYFAQPVAQIGGTWATIPSSYPINFTVSNPPSATQTDQQSMTIYDESLASGWENWSWSSTVDVADTAKPYTPIKDVKWTLTAAYAGLYLHRTTPITTSGYDSLSFVLQASQSNSKLGVTMYDQNGNSTGSIVTLDNYGGDPPTTRHRLYNIPLSAFGAKNIVISGFHIQDMTGTTLQPIYVDRIMLNGNNGDPWVELPSNKLLAYNDALASGWQNWSWDSTINWTGGPAYTGNNSISWTPTAGWAGLDIHKPAGQSTSSYTTVHFALKATAANEEFAVFLSDSSGNPIGTPIALTNYGGDPVTGWWKRYDIPLADLGVTGGATITGIVIQSNKATSQATIYVDEVGLY